MKTPKYENRYIGIILNEVCNPGKISAIGGWGYKRDRLSQSW